MTKHSPKRASVPLLPGLSILARGKVRDTYDLGSGVLLVVATDGISIFDFVLNALVPMKGIVLNAMNHFWDTLLRGFEINTHLVAAGKEIDEYLPESLRRNIDLQSRAIVVDKKNMAPVEFIGRVVLTGSGLSAYKETGSVCGHPLPAGLQDGDELPFILDTPTTKAEEGHDEHMSAHHVMKVYPDQTYRLLQILQIASWHAKQRGIKIADTKFEFAMDGTLCDEILTPDSSRFWEYRAWSEGRLLSTRKAPPPYDKQLVRAWGIEMGINKLKPERQEDVDKVHSLVVPENLIAQTTQTYKYIFWRLTGERVEDYLYRKMGVMAKIGQKSITVVCGSESDWPVVKDVVAVYNPQDVKIRVHFLSCHRNPVELCEFAVGSCDHADAVICVGGKALALPGVLDAFCYIDNQNIPVIGVALGEPGSKALEAAKLSIEEIPGSPVIIDEVAGKAYVGPEGLQVAIDRVLYGELPPAKTRVAKPAKMNVWQNF